VRRILLFLWAVSSLCAQPPAAAPGRLVDLGGHRLHVWCTGEGSPAVVVENGLGDFSYDWKLVRQRVERFTRICTYDRAGYAWSDPGPKPRTFDQLNLELHDALQKLGERGPFILVGHSFGGGVVRQYASTYRSEVAGMVLVDIVPEDQRIPMGPKAARIRDFATGRAIPKPRENMSDADRPPAGANPLDDAEDSQKDWSSEYMARWHATPQAGVLGAMPLVVLTRAVGGYGDNLGVPGAELEAERKRTQAQLARLSTRGTQTIVASGHNMHTEAPDAVADAIRRVVDQVRAR
jgi:pimeloyl-ACP methyl ester carboxylesterase